MSIQADITTALTAGSGVASKQIATDAVPQDWRAPYVMFKRTHHEQVMTLLGPEGTENSIFDFVCVSTTKQGAIDLAAATVTAIEAATALANKYRVPVSGQQDYETNDDEFIETVSYSFWHA